MPPVVAERIYQGGVFNFLVCLVVWGLIPKFVGRWVMLELLKLKKVSHAVAFAVVFILFYERGWKGVVFKNDHFLVFLLVWVLFRKLLGRLTSRLAGRSAQTYEKISILSISRRLDKLENGLC